MSKPNGLVVGEARSHKLEFQPYHMRPKAECDVAVTSMSGVDVMHHIIIWLSFYDMVLYHYWFHKM